MLTRARREKLTLYGLAKLLARLGIPATDGDYAPSPIEPRYKTEAAYIDAYNDWVAVQQDRHYQILKAAAAAPRKAAAKRNKKRVVKAG